MISSWEGIIHKSLLKSSEVLTQALGMLEKGYVSREGIMYGPMCKPIIEEQAKEVLEVSTDDKKQC